MTGRLRVGLDLVHVPDVAGAIAALGERCAGEPDVVARGLAGRLAAKEATVKLLRPTGPQPEWRDIELRRQPGGWVELHLTGRAQVLKEAARLTDVTVSITHEGDTAAAVVVGWCMG